ncbi:MAG TPA: TonB-dependent receptor plug domain-containing protein, partial [Chitinophagaceae bacterium]|nr:TonB-dependent receptor plug domain-containing protein [Chitinophagaceae bacterium]
MMWCLNRLIVIVMLLCLCQLTYSQHTIKGKIVEAETKQPLSGVSIQCTDKACSCGSLSSDSGEFSFKTADTTKQFIVSFIGYEAKQVALTAGDENIVRLYPSESLLQEVVVTANRDAVKRSQAPVAIAAINMKTIEETKPTSIDQLLNKVSGVYMVNLGNEQHQMSIRQPITTKSLFLYLEDGIPVRTTGLFNHNALLEMNMAAVKTIEVIKGPSSSLYGSEAIGGAVNFITLAPTTRPSAKLSLQGNDIGYKRTDLQTTFTKGRWGFALSGYYANKRNSFLEYSNFNKGTITARADYRFNQNTSLNNSITWLDYYSDMPGGIDSVMFSSKTFKNPQTFTYRKVNAVRYRSTLSHNWSNESKSTLSVIYRDNTIQQNPAYAIKDDFRKQGANWVGKKNLAHGEINSSSFNSYAAVAQHRQAINWKNAVAIVGLNADISPSAYRADYIRIDKDSVTKKYLSYTQKDSTLTNYETAINNYAGFFNFEFDASD